MATTTSANGWYFDGFRAVLPEGETGWATNTAVSWSRLMVVPYSATEFRLGMTDSTGDGHWHYIGLSFPMTDPHALKVNFRFKSTKAEGGLARVNISGGTGVTVNTDNEISIGQDVATTADVTFDDITADSLVTNAVRVIDGNQSAGKVLVSDASGNASWQDFGSGAPKYAQFRGNATQFFSNLAGGEWVDFPVTTINSGGFVVTGNNQIELPQGRIYRVDLNLGWFGAEDTEHAWGRFSIFDNVLNQAISQTAHIEMKTTVTAPFINVFGGSGTVSTFVDATAAARYISVRSIIVSSALKLNDTGNGENYVTITIQTVD